MNHDEIGRFTAERGVLIRELSMVDLNHALARGFEWDVHDIE